SDLSTDPALDSNYLADAAINITPDIIKSAGRMRGSITRLLASRKILASLSEQQKEDLETYGDELDFHDEDLENALNRAKRFNPASEIFLAYHDITIEPKFEEWRRNFENIITKRTSLITAETFFEDGSNLIKLYDNLYDKTSAASMQLLEEREEQYRIKRKL